MLIKRLKWQFIYNGCWLFCLINWLINIFRTTTQIYLVDLNMLGFITARNQHIKGILDRVRHGVEGGQNDGWVDTWTKWIISSGHAEKHSLSGGGAYPTGHTVKRGRGEVRRRETGKGEERTTWRSPLPQVDTAAAPGNDYGMFLHGIFTFSSRETRVFKRILLFFPSLSLFCENL